MLHDSKAFSGFSVNDLDKAKRFYGEVLGLDFSESPGQLHLHLSGGTNVFVYEKPDHQPASFTVLNFPVHGIEAVAARLASAGVVLQRYPDMAAETDEHGIFAGGGGPRIGWFLDPAGNVLSILEN